YTARHVRGRDGDRHHSRRVRLREPRRDARHDRFAVRTRVEGDPRRVRAAGRPRPGAGHREEGQIRPGAGCVEGIPTLRMRETARHPTPPLLQTLARWGLAVAALVLVPAAAARAQFDHTHAAWNAMLRKHVVLVSDGKASQVRYADF